MTGALTSAANSAIRLASGASACSTWWTPAAATTLGANTTFLGTDIDASGITIGSTIVWTGRALAFGGTVSTTADTINTVPNCSVASTTGSPAPTIAPTVSGSGSADSSTSGSSLADTGLSLNTISLFATGILLIAIVIQLDGRRRRASGAIRSRRKAGDEMPRSV